MRVVESETLVASTNGFEVATWTAVPESPRGIVVLCHGLTTGADDGGPFIPMRDSLLRRGIATVRFDARCHGQTGGSWRDLSLRGWRDDIVAVGDRARSDHPGLPIGFLAASFSGGPATAAAGVLGEAVAGIVYLNPVLDYPAVYLSSAYSTGAAVLATRGESTLPSWATLRLPVVDVPFSRELVGEFEADRTSERLASMPCAGLVIHGTGDRFVPIASVRGAVKGAKRIRLISIPIARHGFRYFHPLVRRLSGTWLERHLRQQATR